MAKEKKYYIVVVVAIIALFIVKQFDKNINPESSMKTHEEIITVDTHCDIDVSNFTCKFRISN